MKLHRFYVGNIHDKSGPLKLNYRLWINDEHLVRQWLSVLCFKVGDQLVLFNDELERLYKITNVEESHSVKLQLVTEQKRKLPKKHVYLLWSLLTNNKNDLILQKATELGVRNFVPIQTSHITKTGFDIKIARKVITEATEQCGRSDVPLIREPVNLQEAISEYSDLPLFICKQGKENNTNISKLDKVGILIGPEGGWSESEKELFKNNNLGLIDIADFTLRAEVAAIVATSFVLK